MLALKAKLALHHSLVGEIWLRLASLRSAEILSGTKLVLIETADNTICFHCVYSHITPTPLLGRGLPGLLFFFFFLTYAVLAIV